MSNDIITTSSSTTFSLPSQEQNTHQSQIRQFEQQQLAQHWAETGLIKSEGKGNAGSIGLQPVKGIREPDSRFTRQAHNTRGIRERYTALSFGILREIARKVSIIPAIQTTRIKQLKPFSKVSYNDDDVGFTIKLKDREGTPDNKDKKVMKEITEYIKYSGYQKVNGVMVKRDRNYVIMEKATRDMMSIDQVAISLRRDNAGRLVDFYILDGAYIRQVSSEIGFEGDKSIKYVQYINGFVTAKFKEDDLLFLVNNTRTDLLNDGYGYSYVEQSVELITGWLFSMTYNKEVFSSSAQPKGFITFEGENLDQPDLEELQRKWTAMFSGVKGMWKTPFLQRNAKWNTVAPSNRDMEWDRYTEKLETWIAAIHNIDLEEMGVKSQKSGPVLSENKSFEISYSKDRGLKDTLFFSEVMYNKIIEEKPEWEAYELVYTGFEQKDQKVEVEVEAQQNKVYRTINEIRKDHDQPSLGKAGDVIDNQAFIQAQQAEQQAEMEKQMGEQGEGGEGETDDFDYSDEEIDESLSGLEKSLVKNPNNYVEIEI